MLVLSLYNFSFETSALLNISDLNIIIKDLMEKFPDFFWSLYQQEFLFTWIWIVERRGIFNAKLAFCMAEMKSFGLIEKRSTISNDCCDLLTTFNYNACNS